ncbi:predicted protein [Botrytis cinerea T4]|uniref:Uncharacterized protein n=1 Tax=Botryotinia fuckeliana (strain T4) TaxID=999810 RepID=G2Y8W2_BOTF4|nr:predicted protein [Botrytis cinerea T4]
MPSPNTSFHTNRLGWSQEHDVIVVGLVLNYMRLIPPADNNTFFHPSRHRKHAEGAASPLRHRTAVKLVAN